MDFVHDVIAWKRDGRELDELRVRAFVEGVVSGSVPSYQASALLMAMVLRGLSDDETLWMARAMIDSGKSLDLSVLRRPVLDKHSSGGVGDKVTLVLAPLVAACGAIFGKMSGRGLGHTGGTLDKLESIPGFRVQLPQGTSCVSSSGSASRSSAKASALSRRTGCSMRFATSPAPWRAAG